MKRIRDRPGVYGSWYIAKGHWWWQDESGYEHQEDVPIVDPAWIEEVDSPAIRGLYSGHSCHQGVSPVVKNGMSSFRMGINFNCILMTERANITNLKAISLLSSGCAMPLHQMVVWPIQIFVQFNDQALEEAWKLPLHLWSEQKMKIKNTEIRLKKRKSATQTIMTLEGSLLLSSSRRPSTRNSHDATLISPSSPVSFAG